MELADLGGLEGPLQGSIYGPADFPDANTNTVNQPGILNTVSRVTLHHISDISDKLQQTRQWRRKVREILQNHQERVLQFFTVPMPINHPLKVAQTLLQKYGKPIKGEIYKNTSQFLKEYIQEAEPKGIDELNIYLDKLAENRSTETPIQRWISMSRHMLDYMRDVGDELIRIDQKLQNECQHLDSVIEKITQLIGLPDPDIDGFQDMMEAYIEKQFKKHPIEEIYWEYIYTLQKYSILREILIPQRTANQVEPLCCICMTEPIVMAMSPCGHTFCTNCSKRTIVCHVCRQHVTNRIRIYFG